jgi:hypothetical protein
MGAVDPHHSWAEHVETEHRHLCRSIHDLRRAFDAPAETASISVLVAAVLPKLMAYRDEMLAHFALEEEGGYMEEAVARVPSLSQNADKLMAEHKPLMAALERLIARLQKASLSASEWSECRTDFAKFAEQAATHEANENWLLHEGFNLADE